MTTTRRTALAVLVLAGACWLAPEVPAEVSAETDAFDKYVRTIVLSTSSPKNVRIWTVQRARTKSYPLNPDGDANGDLWPVIGETESIPKVAWVAWSRFNGHDYDLAWSRWIEEAVAWAPIAAVEPGMPRGDDLDPDLAFNAETRPHLIWCRDDGGMRRVYLSLFLVSRWMEPFLVSDEGVDSVDPTIEILPDGSIRVEYDTPEGHVIRLVLFHAPDTITDDITPFGNLEITETTTIPDLTR